MSKRELQHRNWEDQLRAVRERRTWEGGEYEYERFIRIQIIGWNVKVIVCWPGYFLYTPEEISNFRSDDTNYTDFLREEFRNYPERFPQWVKDKFMREANINIDLL